MKFIDETYDWENMTLTMVETPLSWEECFETVRDDIRAISYELEHTNATIYPSPDRVFRAFNEVRLENVRLVILGQDPYHNGNATGLCFDVKPGGRLNPSLKNIYRELENENFFPNKNGNLSHLPKQGVLLLNTALTVEKGAAASHEAIWADFTEK